MDTIAAIATPIGTGGIAVIRISGEEAFRIADQIFRGKTLPSSAKSHTLHFGLIVDPQTGEPLDEVVISLYRAPHSYTGEDVVEISCHGGIYLSRKILELVLRMGARLAQPGEFTKRAFLNGRIDLSQAEAVADLIRARTDRSLRSSLSQLRGELSAKIRELRDSLIDICSLLELELDFSEEDIEFVDKEEVITRIDRTLERMDKLISSYDKGRFLAEGVKLAIVGRPNVGKSSLLNALLGRERAIVAPTPGTTRDTLEEALDIDGLLFRVIDTAGLRRARTHVEREGIRRTEKRMEEADLVLWVVDGSEELTPEDEEILERVRSRNQRAIIAVNKIDLPQRIDLRDLREKTSPYPLLRISAKEGTGLGELEKAVVESVLEGGIPGPDGAVVTNLRHREALIRAKDHLGQAKTSLERGMSQEFAALDLRGALDSLGEIIGVTTPEDILKEIFSRFCIGK